MRRISQLTVLCLAAGVVSACNKLDQVITSPVIPTAGVRFINAVPDTGNMDFRFVDIVESNAQWNIPFRNNIVTTSGVPASTMIQFKNTQAGSRHFTVFMNGTTAAVATQIVSDQTVTFEAGHDYTVVAWGYANPGGPYRPAGAPPLRVDVIDETVGDPYPCVYMRVFNASMSTVDGKFYPATGGSAATSPIYWDNVGAYSASPYWLANRETYKFDIALVGTTAAIFPDPTALTGTFPTFSGNPCQAINTGLTSLAATATGYSRSGGSFLVEGFSVGNKIMASGFTGANNNGESTISAVTATSLTVTKTPAPTAEAEAGSRLIMVNFPCDQEGTPGTLQAGSAVSGIVWPGGVPCTTGPQTSTFLYTTGNSSTLFATATGYGRTSGSFLADSIKVGQEIGVCGFLQAANNGLSTVTAVTALSVTVTKTGGTVAEAGTTGSTTLAATATGYQRTAGSFIADGFVVGQTISASGFASGNNNGLSVITAVTATDLTVTKSPATTAEAAAAGRTISNAMTRFMGAARPAMSFMWDRRPARSLGL